MPPILSKPFQLAFTGAKPSPKDIFEVLGKVGYHSIVDLIDEEIDHEQAS